MLCGIFSYTQEFSSAPPPLHRKFRLASGFFRQVVVRAFARSSPALPDFLADPRIFHP
jgi:hypothetical protein